MLKNITFFKDMPTNVCNNCNLIANKLQIQLQLHAEYPSSAHMHGCIYECYRHASNHQGMRQGQRRDRREGISWALQLVLCASARTAGGTRGCAWAPRGGFKPLLWGALWFLTMTGLEARR